MLNYLFITPLALGLNRTFAKFTGAEATEMFQCFFLIKLTHASDSESLFVTALFLLLSFLLFSASTQFKTSFSA